MPWKPSFKSVQITLFYAWQWFGNISMQPPQLFRLKYCSDWCIKRNNITFSNWASPTLNQWEMKENTNAQHHHLKYSSHQIFPLTVASQWKVWEIWWSCESCLQIGWGPQAQNLYSLEYANIKLVFEVLNVTCSVCYMFSRFSNVCKDQSH